MVEHELVVLLERPALARCPERGHLAARDDRQLERALEGDATPPMALAHHPPALVDEREAAVQVVAHDCEERLEPASPDDRVCEALVHRERARELLELLAGEVGERRLRDGDERQLVRDRDRREGQLVGLLDHGRRHVGEAEPDPEAEPGKTVLGQAAHVGALGRRLVAHAQAGREQELAALEELRGVGQLRDVEPADLVGEPLGARRDRELEARHVREVANRQHVAHFDTGAKRYAGTRREATGIPPPFLLFGQKRGRASGLRRPCRPWRCRAR